MLKFYRILSFILLPIAAFIGIGVLLSLMVALANPAMLLNVFIGACVVLYQFLSYRFLVKGIDNQQVLKASFKDWIKVNAFVTIVFSVMSIIQFITVLRDPAFMQKMTESFSAMQVQASNAPSKEVLMKMIKGVAYFMLGYTVALLAHIFITFKLLRQYQPLFKEKE
jgi:hypothetical protein